MWLLVYGETIEGVAMEFNGRIEKCGNIVVALEASPIHVDILPYRIGNIQRLSTVIDRILLVLGLE